MSSDEVHSWGAIIFDHERYQLRARTDEDGLHVFGFRKNNEGEVVVPSGFLLGSNAMSMK